MSPAAPTAFHAATERVRMGADPTAEAADLVDQLSDEELLGMLDGDVPFWPGLNDMTHGGYHSHPWPAACVERLGLPGLRFTDGPRGVVIGTATCFPVSMARGATFDVELEEAIGDAIGAELRAVGANFYGGVCVNLLRHPAWGRAQETYGEDPTHVGELGAALTRGVQRHAMACVKHFALNSMENARFTVDVTCDERALHEVYLPHFRRVVEEGAAAVMSAYNSVNGEWAGQNGELLTDVLRGEWGFEGFTITDFIFGFRDAVASVGAGLDIEMPFRQQRALELPLALADGSLNRGDLEAPAARVIATLLRFAEVLGRPAPTTSVMGCAEHQALARRACTESIVLLRNEGSLLPLDPASLHTVAVVGPLADRVNLGDGGSSDVSPPHAVTALEGLRAALPTTQVLQSEDASAALDATVAIAVVGCTKDDEGEYLGATMGDLSGLFPPTDHPVVGTDAPLPHFDEPAAPFSGDAAMAVGGDRRSLRLSAADEALIADVRALCPNVVVAVMGGSAVVMPWAEDVPGLLLWWYPGQEGGHALADILLGAVPPSGRLPCAIPRDEDHLVRFDPDATEETYGLLHGQWHLDAQGIGAHFPFGFGLSTTTFELVAASATGPRPTTVTVEVHNSGGRAGTDVVQVYGSVPDSGVLRPARRLVGFARVDVAPGTTAQVGVPIDLRALDVRTEGTLGPEPNTAISLTVARHAEDPGISVAW
ncbi:MAG: glycoside hydrolase family 3 C-terminal domain-containing protein [Microthrixaceae bacterium]